MAKERDYKKENEYKKQKGKMITASVALKLAERFEKQLSLDDVTKNAFFYACIKAYLNNEITVDDLNLYI